MTTWFSIDSTPFLIGWKLCWTAPTLRVNSWSSTRFDVFWEYALSTLPLHYCPVHYAPAMTNPKVVIGGLRGKVLTMAVQNINRQFAQVHATLGKRWDRNKSCMKTIIASPENMIKGTQLPGPQGPWVCEGLQQLQQPSVATGSKNLSDIGKVLRGKRQFECTSSHCSGPLTIVSCQTPSSNCSTSLESFSSDGSFP